MCISSINADDIKVIDSLIPRDLQTFIGTQQIHQFNWTKENPSIIRFNTLSCFECNPADKNCIHFHQGILDYQENTKKNHKQENTNLIINLTRPKIKSVKVLEKSERIILKENFEIQTQEY